MKTITPTLRKARWQSHREDIKECEKITEKLALGNILREPNRCVGELRMSCGCVYKREGNEYFNIKECDLHLYGHRG